jgi:hypothetical protein
MKYGIKEGQIYIAADGSKVGHIVVDMSTLEVSGDVITRPFTEANFGVAGNRIDAFKLAMVRYKLVESKPDWFPVEKSGLAIGD